MEIKEKVLTDAYILKPRIFEDERGYFYETFNQNAFKLLINTNISFVQDNQSLSSKGTLRGLHIQTGRAAQAKLVRVTRGVAYDVAVDLRINSPTFKHWHGVELSEMNHVQFFIPKGFAHAFVALEDDTIFQYKVDNYYSKENETGVTWNDDELNIAWPKLKLKISEKDMNLPKLNQLNLKNLW